MASAHVSDADALILVPAVFLHGVGDFIVTPIDRHINPPQYETVRRADGTTFRREVTRDGHEVLKFAVGALVTVGVVVGVVVLVKRAKKR